MYYTLRSSSIGHPKTIAGLPYIITLPGPIGGREGEGMMRAGAAGLLLSTMFQSLVTRPERRPYILGFGKKIYHLGFRSFQLDGCHKASNGPEMFIVVTSIPWQGSDDAVRP